MTSPYTGIPKRQWPAKTKSLVKEHPLNQQQIVKVVLGCWNSIFESQIGGLRIGQDISPTPQAMGLFLHELIPHELQTKYPKTWRKNQNKDEKDIVCINRDRYSVELKTSSHKDQIFGNRSYAQQPTNSGKSKAGYFIAVNFQKFSSAKSARRPEIIRIRFGWLDHTDWIGQTAASGQQARLSTETYKNKFVTLYEA